jgi:hypothetical protein
MRHITLMLISLLVGLATISGTFTRTIIPSVKDDTFSFVATADMREFAGPGVYDSAQYFRGATQSVAAHGAGAFMLSPGDIDPPAGVMWTITQTLGSAYIWYPVVGNHESETPEDMDWLRLYEYGAVHPGPAGCPETTYSFDYSNSHFVVLNQYCDSSGDTVTNGDIPDHLYDWLRADLQATTATNVFVIGHEPAFPQPDADNGRLRHEFDSLNAHPSNRNRFWDLLREYEVAAYLCGHTHNYSLARIDGVWQLDAGHARGLGDSGARSTFVLIQVNGTTISYQTYRDDANGGGYSLMHAGILYEDSIYLPLLTQ